MPRRLVILSFDDPYHAEEARTALRRLEDAGALQLVNAAVMVHPVNGPRRISLDMNQTQDGLRKGQILGLILAGLSHVFPLIPLGTAIGALYGRLTSTVDLGFLKKTLKDMPPGSSALLMLVTQSDHLKVAETLARFRPQVQYTEVPPERQQEIIDHLRALYTKTNAPVS